MAICQWANKLAKSWFASSGLVAGQYQGTPRNITTFDPDPTDRPFSGWFYGGIRVVLTHPDDWMRQSFEVDLGPIGPPAFARELQGGLHVARQHRVPKGWDHQGGPAVGLNGLYNVQGRLPLASIFDLTPGLGVGAGTVQTFGLAEVTARFGRGLSGWPVGMSPITLLAQRKRWELGVFGALQWRYYLFNRYLDGPIGGGPPEVTKIPSVHDYAFGAFIRYKQWRVTYTAVARGREFEGEQLEPDAKHHNFGSIAISRELSDADDWSGASPSSSLTRNWLFEIGMGQGYSSFQQEPPRGDGGGLAGRLGVSKGLTTLPFEQQLRRRDRWRFGYELVGVVREGGPPPLPGRPHRDDFLRTQAGTVRWRPFSPSSSLGRIDLRAGGGLGTAKREITADNGEDFVEQSDNGPALLLGVDYVVRLGGGLSFGIDTTWSHVWIDPNIVSGGSFWSAVAVIQWHP